MEDGKQTIADLQVVDAGLAAFLDRLGSYGLDESEMAPIRATVREMLESSRSLCQMFDRFGLSPDIQTPPASLNDLRMRRAVQLNADITQDLEAGRIRSDQEALSSYLLALNQAIERVDRIFGSRRKD